MPSVRQAELRPYPAKAGGVMAGLGINKDLEPLVRRVRRIRLFRPVRRPGLFRAVLLSTSARGTFRSLPTLWNGTRLVAMKTSLSSLITAIATRPAPLFPLELI